MFDKCWRNVGWKFMSFEGAIQHVLSNMQSHSFFHLMSNCYRFNLFCHSHLSQFPQPFFFSLFFAYFLWPACLFFFRNLQFLLLHLRILFHFDLAILINSHNLLRHCSSSFRLDACEIRSSNIQNDVIRIKCWMIQGINQSNLKTVLAEPENVDWNIFSRSNFHPVQFFFIQHDFLFFCYFWSNIYSNMAFLLCWLKCRIGLTRPLSSLLFVIHVNDSHDSKLLSLSFRRHISFLSGLHYLCSSK